MLLKTIADTYTCFLTSQLKNILKKRFNKKLKKIKQT